MHISIILTCWNSCVQVADERKGMAIKMESSTNQIWDQIRHVESSLNQRLGLAETAQASTLQEVDDTKETANEVLGRVDETKRHLAALESKLESFNSAVAAAIAPLHNRWVSLGSRVSTRQRDFNMAREISRIQKHWAKILEKPAISARNRVLGLFWQDFGQVSAQFCIAGILKSSMLGS